MEPMHLFLVQYSQNVYPIRSCFFCLNQIGGFVILFFFSKWIHWCCGHPVTQVLYTWLLFSIFCDLVHIVLPVSPWVISLAGCKNDVKRYWKRCPFLNAEWSVDVFIHTYGDSKTIRLGCLDACAPSCYWQFAISKHMNYSSRCPFLTSTYALG